MLSIDFNSNIEYNYLRKGCYYEKDYSSIIDFVNYIIVLFLFVE